MSFDIPSLHAFLDLMLSVRQRCAVIHAVDTCMCTAQSYARTCFLQQLHSDIHKDAYILLACQVLEVHPLPGPLIDTPQDSTKRLFSVLMHAGVQLMVDLPHRLAAALAVDCSLSETIRKSHFDGTLEDEEDAKCELWDLCNDLWCSRLPLHYSSLEIALAAVVILANRHGVSGINAYIASTGIATKERLASMLLCYAEDAAYLSSKVALMKH